MTQAKYDQIKKDEELRDAFAIAALQGHLANGRLEFKNDAAMCQSCFRIADAMLEARKTLQ